MIIMTFLDMWVLNEVAGKNSRFLQGYMDSSLKRWKGSKKKYSVFLSRIFPEDVQLLLLQNFIKIMFKILT